MSGALGALEAAYAPDAAGEAVRLTPRGLYAATPLDTAVAGVAAALASLGDPGPLSVLDAGSGDARVLAALALAAPDAWRLHLVGVECDPALHATALRRRERLAALPTWPAARPLDLRLGDLADPGCVDPGEFDLVLHYPDGGEAALARLLDERGRPGARLLLLQPDPPPPLAPLRPLWRAAVPTRSGVAWHAALFGRAGGRSG